MTATSKHTPAFPVPYSNERDGPTLMPTAGMSLRDYFAAKAMTALIQLCNNDAREEGLGYPEHIAAVSYGMADAMLKARES